MRETFGQPLPTAGRLSPLTRGIAAHVGDGRPASWAGFIWHRSQAPLFTDREQMHLFFLRELYQVGSIEEPASQATPIPSAIASAAGGTADSPPHRALAILKNATQSRSAHHVGAHWPRGAEEPRGVC
jgi:hypothetical protein